MTTEDTDEDITATHKVRSIWLGDGRWEKLKLLKDELGTWTRFTDIVCEQLLASGLVPQVIREQIEAINKAHGLDHLDDSAWRDAYRISDPQGRARTVASKITTELEEINLNILKLTQAVEDHAMAMLDADALKTDGSTIPQIESQS